MDHSTTTHGSGSLLGQLRSHKLALFCGAGISILPPSSLPNWRALADGVIRAIGQAAGETPRLADLAQGSGRPYLGQLLQAELRPDVVMEIIYDIMQERALGALEVLDIITPNANHFLIAHLAGAGFLNCVLTTNFDRLIEIACQQQGVPVRTVVTPEEYATDPGPDQGLTLYKLHGSIERPETMVASIDNITRGLDQQKEAVLQRLLSSQYFLFLGYSGNDFAINADYLLLERTRPLVLGITWNLRPGEESAIVSGLLDHYGEKGEVVHAELPSLLRELCVGLGIEPPPLPETEPVERPPLEESLAAWGENLSEIDVCFGLGRLYLYSGNWDGALESMKIFYRKVRDLKQGTYRDLGLASYYLAHAYERFKAFNKFDTDTVFDIFLLLNQARITFTTLGDEFMLARAYHTEARYVGEQDLQRAWSLYQQALDTYEAAGATAELGEALVDMGDLLARVTHAMLTWPGIACRRVIGWLPVWATFGKWCERCRQWATCCSGNTGLKRAGRPWPRRFAGRASWGTRPSCRRYSSA